MVIHTFDSGPRHDDAHWARAAAEMYTDRLLQHGETGAQGTHIRRTLAGIVEENDQRTSYIWRMPILRFDHLLHRNKHKVLRH
jgi:hypothetical protein